MIQNSATRNEVFRAAGFTSGSSYAHLAFECSSTSENLMSSAHISRLDPASEIYHLIRQYAESSADGRAIKIENIYQINRKGDPQKLTDSFSVMLWHGTKPYNIAGIIEKGLLPGGGSNPARGIYLADRTALSMSYTAPSRNGNRYLCLAEVTPGNIFEGTMRSQPPGYDTVKITGLKIPSQLEDKHYNGAIIPCGITVNNQPGRGFGSSYNQYIVFNPNRVIIKFLIEFKN